MIAHEDGPVARVRNRLLDEFEVLGHGQPDRPPPQQQLSIPLTHEALSSLHIFNSAVLKLNKTSRIVL
jgi:hypothetical protein